MSRTLTKLEGDAAKAWLAECVAREEQAREDMMEAVEEHGAEGLNSDRTDINEYDNLGNFERAVAALALADAGFKYVYTADKEDDKAA
jgi:hypothetical protein